MVDRRKTYNQLRRKMEQVGFVFESEQNPHLQNRKEPELKFIHPKLTHALEEAGYKVASRKFYIKPLSDNPNSEIGLVTGKSSPLNTEPFFTQPNSFDTFRNTPAWTNRKKDPTLDNVLASIEEFLKTSSTQFQENEHSRVGLPDGQDAIKSEKIFREGKIRDVTQTKYERSSTARKKCLAHFGYSCRICDFNFEEAFGELGRGFIHIHHITPLSEIGEEYEVDPVRDLIPLCPNCHAMIHSRQPAFHIEELKELRTAIANDKSTMK